MAGYRATPIRPPASDTEFEKNCVVLFRELLGDPNVKRLGTRGQRQDGVDLIGYRNRHPKKIVGIQCKLKTGQSRLTPREVRTEVNAALKYKPHLSEYFIVTTSKDDTKLDQLAQQLMHDQEAVGRRFHIEVWGWDTLQEKIDQSEAAKKAFDPEFSPSVASHDRKLDALLAGQKTQATRRQVAAFAQSLEKESQAAPMRLPAKFADRELKEELSKALRRRGFVRTKTPAELATLALRAIEGDLSFGSNIIRSEICERAARANAVPETFELAKRFRDSAAQLDPSRDLFVPDALLKGAEGDPDAILRDLKTRTDADARSALFAVLITQRGKEAALSWVENEHLAPKDLNAIGATNLIIKEIENGQFDAALGHATEIPAHYYDQCPALLLLRAQVQLASILPTDQKAALFQTLPLNPKVLQLASGSKREEAIQSAGRDITALRGLIKELDLGYLDDFLSELDLWLRLENPPTEQSARAQLAEEIVDPAKTLQRVRLALAYDVPFNADALQRHLTAQKEMGGWTADERFAAFLIVYNSGDPEKLSDFFERHHDDLFAQEHLVRAALAGIEIEVLARTGRFDEARRHITLHHDAAHMSDEQARDIAEIVDHIEKDDEAENLRQRYSKSGHLGDLRLLVIALIARRDEKQLADYAPLLARATNTQADFALAIKSLFRCGRYWELLAFTDEMPQLFGLDDEYAALKGWSLFRLGRIMEARAIARALLERRDFSGDRELAINTAIETGDWGNLQGILAREATRADSLPPNDLIRLARLAVESGSTYVDHFRDAALRTAPDDPQVNLTAYMIATEQGNEYQGSRAHEWFERAIRLSGADGPVRSVPLQQIAEDAPSWNERVENTGRLLRQAEAPLFVVSKVLRRQMMDLTLGQALRNIDDDDARIRYPVFAFFGLQTIRALPSLKSVALDLTSIITLDYLGLLERVIECLDAPTIAPSTLSELFLERQFLKIQQPSQIAKAERIQALIAKGRLKVAAREPDPDPALSKDIGRDLTSLLLAAKREDGLVVRSAPVPKLGTFLEETVDMTSHAALLTDTRSVLSFLFSNGKIDSDVKKNAQTYLDHVDAGWSAAPVIDGTKRLYLDDLAVTYLDHVEVLDPLTRAVDGIFVHKELDSETREALRYGKHIHELLDAIDRIRAALNKGIESGKVQVSSRRIYDEDDESEDGSKGNNVEMLPALDLMCDLSQINAVVVDDRCLNKLPTWTDSSGRSAVAASTLSILEALRAHKHIDNEVFWRARHRLRAAGYMAMPLEPDELKHHVVAAPVVGQRIRETPELRAVRESLSIGRINDAFIAAEDPWLAGIRFCVYKALREIWAESTSLDEAEARGDWLLSIYPSPLAWCLHPENESLWATVRQQLALQTGLLMVFIDGTPQRRQRYASWLDDRLLKGIREAQPEMWDAILDFLKSYIERLMEVERET